LSGSEEYDPETGPEIENRAGPDQEEPLYLAVTKSVDDLLETKFNVYLISAPVRSVCDADGEIPLKTAPWGPPELYEMV
jgi:hypothetical protein